MSLRTALSLLAAIVFTVTGHAQIITIDTNTVYDYADPSAFRLNDKATAVIWWWQRDWPDGMPSIKALGNGSITIRFGRIPSDAVADDSSTIDILSGSPGGREPTFLVASARSVVHIFGGNFVIGDAPYQLVAGDQATANIDGTGLSPKLWFDDFFKLLGRLADGDGLDVTIRGYVVLHEVPELSTWRPASLGLVLLRHGVSRLATLGERA